VRLRENPEGRPLLFLTPKQATFQVERQLLKHADVPGFTRLQVLSPDRLASEILEEAGSPLRLLSEEGRIMVLRSLLNREHERLEVFRSTARLIGFARQLSLTLRNCRRYRLDAGRLREQAGRLDGALAGKLRDCALLLEHYEAWLKEHDLQDSDILMDAAAEIIRKWPEDRAPRLEALWLDGFAEMTPQEQDFLTALLPHCERSTLAFCFNQPEAIQREGFHPWALVAGTYNSLYHRLAQRANLKVTAEHLPSASVHSRFARTPALAHLEQHWSTPKPFPQSEDIATPLPVRLVQCPHPEAEVVVAAHEILRHIRNGGRLHETAILVRSLETHHAALQRVLRRYEIPFFLDQRESVAHHPLAELTRYGLRVVAFHWRHEDWFGALKTGLLPAGSEEVDLLETEALARGWEGETWHHPLAIPEEPQRVRHLESVRQRVLAPLQQLRKDLLGPRGDSHPSGELLSRSLMTFWEALDVAGQLEAWAEQAAPNSRFPAMHQSVWEQVQNWADNLAMAFEAQTMALTEWLPVVEAGLSGLTAGAIPTCLDQVLVGAVDRSRNPDLKLLVVLGLQEGVFPAPPSHPGLLTEADHRELESLGTRFGTDSRLQIAHERYFGYVAFTRPSEHLVLTWSERDTDDRLQQASPFISVLKRLFPALESESYSEPTPGNAQHACELRATTLAAMRTKAPLAETLLSTTCPAGEGRCQLEHLAHYDDTPVLRQEVAGELYRSSLQTSVSALERFAQCPFRYFVSQGLRAKERKLFVADFREEGTLQHEILAQFHQELASEGKRWRDVAPTEGRERIQRIADAKIAGFREGLFEKDPTAAYAARALTRNLQDFVEATLLWMTTYSLDPAAVELGFGLGDNAIPGWVLKLNEEQELVFRGIIDRIDIGQIEPGGKAHAVVIDYKSGAQKLQPILMQNGIQLQLAAYLATIRSHPEISRELGHSALEPGGVFYITLRNRPAREEHRTASANASGKAGKAYQHLGRYRLDLLPALDSGQPNNPSGQFNYRFKNDGTLYANSIEAMQPGEFLKLLDSVEDQLKTIGRGILSGDTRVDPYRKGSTKACDRCDYQAICRIDPWSHSYRILTETTDEDSNDA
jgi:ATP-dependent helicase/nuclease subunit B